MMRTILKYPLDIFGAGEEFIEIYLPAGSELLSVQLQPSRNGVVPQLWALSRQGEQLEPRRIWVFGTGVPITQNVELRYIDTVQIHDGNLVMHFFEEIK